MNNQPLISVFLPYYNDKKFLAEAIKSILQQTYKNFELFLFNHCSTDGSDIIAHSFKDGRIKHVKAERNLGAGSGQNLKKTLPLMKGKYVKLLCADDILKRDCLENLVNFLEKNPNKDFVFSDMDYIDEAGNSLETKWSIEKAPFVDFESDELQTLYKYYRGKSHLAYPTSLIKKEVLLKLNLDETYIMLFDVSLWVAALVKGYKIGFIPISTINYRISQTQLSSISSQSAGKQGYLELFSLLNLFFQISDLNMCKYLLQDSVYAQILSKGDEDLIPFCMAEAFLRAEEINNPFIDQWGVRVVTGYLKMKELLDNPIMAQRIKNKFNFGITEFRKAYSKLSNLPEQTNQLNVFHRKKSRFKTAIYSTPSSKLSFGSLIYLLLRRIYYTFISILTFKFVKRKMCPKQKKQYTV